MPAAISSDGLAGVLRSALKPLAKTGENRDDLLRSHAVGPHQRMRDGIGQQFVERWLPFGMAKRRS